MFHFRAYGNPRPQGSKRHVGNNRFIEASAGLKEWREAVARSIFEQQAKNKDFVRFEEPVVVNAVFLMPRPGTVKRLWPSVSPDLDKLQRGLGDAMSINSELLADDALIVEWQSSKVYVDPHEAGVVVTVAVIQPERLDEIKSAVIKSLSN